MNKDDDFSPEPAENAELRQFFKSIVNAKQEEITALKNQLEQQHTDSIIRMDKKNEELALKDATIATLQRAKDTSNQNAQSAQGLT